MVQRIIQAHKRAEPSGLLGAASVSPMRGRKLSVFHSGTSGSRPIDDECRAYRSLGEHRHTQRKVPQGRADEKRLSDDIVKLADKYRLYRYCMGCP
jgi:hypothetical protein